MTFARRFSDKRTQDFTEQYNAFYPLIFSSIYHKINDFHAAEDICQEVFIRFYNKMDEVLNPRKWLFGTLRLVVFEHYKKSGSSLDLENILEDASVSFVNGFRDTRIIIEEALESIYSSSETDEKEKILFNLIAMYNYTYAQAGRELGYGYKQTRYRFARIVEKLEDYLKKRGINKLEDLL